MSVALTLGSGLASAGRTLFLPIMIPTISAATTAIAIVRICMVLLFFIFTSGFGAMLLSLCSSAE